MRRANRIAFAWCLPAALALSLVGPSRAVAADDADAEALVHQGVELRRQGHNDLALPLLERAYKTAPAGRTAAQLGLVKLALDAWLDARTLLDESLKRGGPWVEKNRAVLESSLEMARQHIGRLTITGSPSGASVLLDGKAVATLPMTTPIELPEGRRSLVVRAAGFSDFTRDLVVRGAQSDLIEVHLETPASPAAPAPSPIPASEPAPAPSADASTHHPILRWVAAGAATGALVFGIVEHVRWNNGVHDFDAVTTGTGPQKMAACAESAPMYGVDASCASLHGSYTTARTLAFVGYGAAAALAATSAILFVLDARPAGSSEAHVAQACGPDLVHNGWQCVFRF